MQMKRRTALSDLSVLDDMSLSDAAMTDPEGRLRVRMPEQPTILRPPRVWPGEESAKPVLRFEVPISYYSLPTSQWGWQPVRDATGLLDQFRKLSSDPEGIRGFAEAWGPLWIIDPADNFRSRGEIGSEDPEVLQQLSEAGYDSQSASSRRQSGRKPYFLSLFPGIGELANWPAYEKVDLWRMCALEAQTALTIIAALQKYPPEAVPTRYARVLLSCFDIRGESIDSFAWYWREAIYPNSKLQGEGMIEPEIIQPLLAAAINRHLVQDAGSCRLVSDWDSLRLSLHPGLGFLRTVWLLIAQAASRDRAVGTCADCGKPFVRPYGVRVPKPNDNHYCSECGQNEKGAKKLWARKHREQLRTASQQETEGDLKVKEHTA
jgi:hypothetical protein